MRCNKLISWVLGCKNGGARYVYDSCNMHYARPSWTVISDIEDGKSESIEKARERVLMVIATVGTDNFTTYLQKLSTIATLSLK